MIAPRGAKHYKMKTVFARSVGSFWRALLILLPVAIGCFPAAAQSTSSITTLDALISAKQYPELERALTNASLSPADTAYYNGVLANRLNRAQKSIELLQPVLPALESSNLSRAEIASCSLADDFVKLSQYGKASQTYTLAAHIAESQSKESFCHASREAARWALFGEAPAQTVASGSPAMIHGNRDKLGLVQLPIIAGGYTGSWVLDTGANVTVIRRSVADRIGVQLSTSGASAQGSSGKSVDVRAGIIPELKIGTLVLRNVPTLIVDDADLNFPSVGYEIDGSLGLPALMAMGTMTLYADGSVVFGSTVEAKTTRGTTHTLFMERSTPLVAADLGYGQQLFVLDTGAQGTILSSLFFAQAKGNVQTGEAVTLDLAAAGGVGSMAAFGSQHLVANFSGACVPLTQAHVLTTESGAEDDFYGVIGQDALRQVASVTLDFQNMQFVVRGGEKCSTLSASLAAR